jgi:adenylate cyclase
MLGITQEEKNLLKQGVDIQISQVSNQVNQTVEQEGKQAMRNVLKTLMGLIDKVDSIEPKK